jgi:hypothetical protein
MNVIDTWELVMREQMAGDVIYWYSRSIEAEAASHGIKLNTAVHPQFYGDDSYGGDMPPHEIAALYQVAVSKLAAHRKKYPKLDQSESHLDIDLEGWDPWLPSDLLDSVAGDERDE